MQNIPKDVQWLLDFANLSYEQGKINLQSLDFVPILNRPPVKPPKDIGVIQTLPHSGLNTITDQAGNKWIRTWSDPVFLGKMSYPCLQDFKGFFIRGDRRFILIEIADEVKKAIVTFDDEIDGAFQFFREPYMYLLESFWVFTRRGLFSTLSDGKDRGFDVSEYRKAIIRHLKRGSEGTLPYDLCVNIQAWLLDHTELHSRLRVCRLCGMFWLAGDSERGRRQLFCGKACRDRFHYVSHALDIENKKKQRLHKKGKAKEQILEYLKNNGCTPEDAEYIYEAEGAKNPKNVSSLQNFKRTYGDKYL